MSESVYQKIVSQALKRLICKEGYSQMDIFQKLQQLDIGVSRASISNLWNNNRKASLPLLRKAAEGLQKIMERELCLKYDTKIASFTSIEDCVARPIIFEKEAVHNNTVPSYSILDGRLNVSDKVALYENANFEVIELGLQLRSFKSYFSAKRESAFIDPLSKKLEEGVNFKCYIADSDGSFFRRYMEDRAVTQATELDVLEEAKKTTMELRNLFLQLNRNGSKGRMELFKYNHFPYYHASISDGSTERGLLYISPYLYGVSRANAPVIKVSRKANKVLYRKYWRSIKALIESKRITRLV